MSNRAKIEDIGTLAEIMGRLVADVSYWEGEARNLAQERDLLKAENEALRAQVTDGD